MMEQRYKVQRNIFYICSLFLALSILYVILYHVFEWNFSLPFSDCPFHDILRLYCPGCGGTRAVKALFEFRLLDSLIYNPIVLYIVVIGLYYYTTAFYTFIIRKNGLLYYRLPYYLLWVALGIVVSFFVIRNVLLIFFKIDYIGDFIH